jgi:hypothetical protein
MVELDKGAVTRMDNTKKQAKRMQMPGNQAAQQSLRNQVHAPPKSKVNAVGTVQKNYDDVLQPQASAMPTEQSGLPPQPEFDPAVFKEEMGNHLLGNIKTTQFLNTAAAKDATTGVILKEQFNQFNPNKTPDSRSMIKRILGRMGVDPNAGQG